MRPRENNPISANPEIFSYRLSFLFPLLLLIGSCTPKPFFEDPSDPGLTRFTNRGYDAGSAYINDQAWVTGYSSFGGTDASLIADTNLNRKDSLYLSFTGEYKPGLPGLQPEWRNYYQLLIALPVKKNFSLGDFLQWNGRLFPADTTQVTIYLSNGFPPEAPSFVRGSGKIYFTHIQALSDPTQILGMAGLFEGKIGDSISITRGRFDFRLGENQLIFH